MPPPLLSNADGVIDFTVPAASAIIVAKAAERGIVHIIGTTGLLATTTTPRSRPRPPKP